MLLLVDATVKVEPETELLVRNLSILHLTIDHNFLFYYLC